MTQKEFLEKLSAGRHDNPSRLHMLDAASASAQAYGVPQGRIDVVARLIVGSLHHRYARNHKPRHPLAA